MASKATLFQAQYLERSFQVRVYYGRREAKLKYTHLSFFQSKKKKKLSFFLTQFNIK